MPDEETADRIRNIRILLFKKFIKKCVDSWKFFRTKICSYVIETCKREMI